MSTEPPVVDLRPSPPLALLLTLVHGAALAVPFALPLPPWLAWPLAGGIVFGGLQNVARHALLRTPGAVVTLARGPTGLWLLVPRRGTPRTWRLLGDSFVHPRLLVLRFADGRRRTAVVLLPGMADARALRRLRARLLSGTVAMEPGGG